MFKFAQMLTAVAVVPMFTGCAALPKPASGDFYYGFTLIDPATKRRTENAYVEVKNGVIAQIGSSHRALTAGPRVHDLTGRYVLPGFIDAHAHITSTGIQQVEVKDGQVSVKMESDDRITQHNARIALARGVTTVRDPGGDPVANAHYDQMVRTGAWIGPEALHAGAVMQPPPFGGSMFLYPRTDVEWDAEAAREAALGMKYFKLYTSLSEKELATGIATAHRHGLKAIAHLNEVNWQRAVDLGIDGLEHALPTSPDLLEPAKRAQYATRPDSTFMYRWFELVDYDGPLMQKLIRSLADRQIPVDMTFIVNEIIYNVDQVETVALPTERQDILPDVLNVILPQLRLSATGWTADDYRRARAVMPKVLEFGRRLHEAGVPMMIGTDAGGGTFFARELELHHEAGIPTWDILRMATSDAARIMGLGGRIGRIAKGYEADLVILEADPVADIKAADKVFAVLNNGVLLHSSELRATAARQN